MSSAQVYELLRLCTVEHDWSEPPAGIADLLRGLPAHDVGSAAAAHGVTNLAYLSTRQVPELDEELRSLLATVYHLNLTHHMKVIGELGTLGATLDEREIPYLVVKGPILAEVVYPRNDLRAYGDLDIVVPHRRFGDAITALVESGCDIVDRNWRLIRRELRGQIHITARFGTAADIHWHLINRTSVRRGFAIDMDELFERARRVSLDDGPAVLTLDPQDTLLQLAHHAALSGGAKLAWLKDIDSAAREPTIDWDEIVRRARRWRAAGTVGMSFRRSVHLLGAPVPADVLRDLGGSRVWLSIVRGSERLSPPDRPPNRPTLTRSVVRATRDGFASSVAALVQRLALDVSERGGSVFGHRRQIAAAAGDEADRMAYFEAVREGGRRAA